MSETADRLLRAIRQGELVVRRLRKEEAMTDEREKVCPMCAKPIFQDTVSAGDEREELTKLLKESGVVWEYSVVDHLLPYIRKRVDAATATLEQERAELRGQLGEVITAHDKQVANVDAAVRAERERCANQLQTRCTHRMVHASCNSDGLCLESAAIRSGEKP